MKINNRVEVNYRYNSKYQEKKQEAIEFILDKNYGDKIPFEQLARILGFNIEDESENRKFKNVMSKVKNVLIDHGYILKTVTGVGYYILKPKHISSYCYRTYVDRTKVLLEKSERILRHVDQTELSDIRKKEHLEMTRLNQDIYNEVGLVVESSDYGKNRHYYNNLND